MKFRHLTACAATPASINASVPAAKAVHVILDSYAAHKHSKVRGWLDRHPRTTFHFTPTSCSWLNAVEGFFAKLTKRRLRRGVFHSVVDLQAATNRFVAEHNEKPKPFTRTADPDRIIAVFRRGHQALDSVQNEEYLNFSGLFPRPGWGSRRGKAFAHMIDPTSDEVRIGSRDEERFAVGAVIEAQGRPGRFLLQVADLSLTGVRVCCPSHQLTPGDWLLVDLSLAPQRVCVVWAKGIMAGCEFAEPLQPVVMRIILKALIPKPEEHEALPHGNSARPGTDDRTIVHDSGTEQHPYIPRQVYSPRNRRLRL